MSAFTQTDEKPQMISMNTLLAVFTKPPEYAVLSIFGGFGKNSHDESGNRSLSLQSPVECPA
jgi:hypothetical protein